MKGACPCKWSQNGGMSSEDRPPDPIPCCSQQAANKWGKGEEVPLKKKCYSLPKSLVSSARPRLSKLSR